MDHATHQLEIVLAVQVSLVPIVALVQLITTAIPHAHVCYYFMCSIIFANNYQFAKIPCVVDMDHAIRQMELVLVMQVSLVLLAILVLLITTDIPTANVRIFTRFLILLTNNTH